jgi:HD-GYP domain-containing protein (c-di-GMP phosphodiesterase class II)
VFKKYSLKQWGQSLFSKWFGFESGVDITDDVQVLVRRNIVIKNIIFVSNLMYSVLLFVLSVSNNGNVVDWVITVLAFPVTYSINQILKKLIYIDQTDKTKQNVAMYVAGLYMFFSSILIYARLYSVPYYETAAYILIYYSIVVISLYQDKKLLSSSFQTVLVFLTVIHLLWTYNLQAAASGYSVSEFIPIFFTSDSFQDILLRTLFFILFYAVVYVIVSMGQYMQEQRKLELMKRRQVQNDFYHIVHDLFSVVFSSSEHLLHSRHAHKVRELSMKLGQDAGFSTSMLEELSQYALIHLKFEDIKSMLHADMVLNEVNYKLLKDKTELGSKIAKRLQLAQKCESIARAQTEGVTTEAFIDSMNAIQQEMPQQAILLADLYITLRGIQSYKRPLQHSAVIKLMKDELNAFFDHTLMDRFIKFEDEYQEMFDRF